MEYRTEISGHYEHPKFETGLAYPALIRQPWFHDARIRAEFTPESIDLLRQILTAPMDPNADTRNIDFDDPQSLT